VTRLVLETSTFADVIKRAASVAPTRGEAFDKASGILIDVDPENLSVIVRTTDTTMFYLESMTFIKAEGARATWRLPSMILNSFAGKLPIKSGNTVTLDDKIEPPRVVLSCNRTKAKLNTLDPSFYPSWDALEVEDLFEVQDFGGLIKQVLWATANNLDVLSGVAIDSEGIWTTDRYRAAHGIRKIEGWGERIVVPAKMLSKVLPDKGSLSIGVAGNFLVVQPNEYAQIRAVTFDAKFLPVERIIRQEFDYKSFFDRDEFSAMLAQACDFTLGSRQNTLKMFIGQGEVALMMNNNEYGLFGSVLDCSGSAESHARITISFKPENLRDALAAFPNKVVEMQYNQDRETARKGLIKFKHADEYESVLQPLQEREPEND